MSIFKYDDRHKALIAEINGVRFCCEEEKDGYASQAQELADVYEDKVPNIVAFILDEVCSMFGDISEEDQEQKGKALTLRCPGLVGFDHVHRP